MEDRQPQRRPQRSEVREFRHRRSRPSFRAPVGFLVGMAVFAALLQWTGTVDLGLPIGAGPFASNGGVGHSLSVADAQLDLRNVVSSAAALVEQGTGSRDAGERTGSRSRGATSQRTREATRGSESAGDASSAELLAGTPAADDSAGQLPPPGQRTDGYRSEVERAWFTGSGDLTDRARQARTRALQLGAENYEGASRALLAPEAPGERLDRALLAVRLSPDLPLARMELGAAYFDDGQYLYAVREVIAGIASIPKNLEATLWLAASLLTMFAAVLTIGSLAFIVWVGAGVFRHAAHDVGDIVSKAMPEFGRAAMLASLLLVPVLMGEALMGLVVGLFFLAFTYCEAGYRRALALAAVLLILGLYPVTRLAGMALTALDSDPVAAAAHAVVRSMSSSADVETLRSADDEDWLAQAALALHERRSGDAAAAKARYEALLRKTPTDPFVLVALSNMAFQQGDNELAIKLGERAAATTRSATLLFNLSQVYARSFQMNEFEGAMAQAQLVDADRVAELSRTKAPEFVGDLPFPLAPIRDRMIKGAGGERFVHPVSRALMPGRIGESSTATAIAFAGAAFLGLLLGGRWDHASTCTRCGRRICRRCDGTVWNNQICDGCHHLFHRPESTDPAMRMARLSELRERESRVGRLATLASVVLPGVGGLLAKRPDLSFLGLFFFAWACFLLLWRDGVVVDPLAIGAAGPLLFGIAGGLAVLGYAGVVAIGLSIRRNL